MRIVLSAVALAGTLAGCATAPPPMLWLRSDGQTTRNNPVLAQQAEMDRTICLGEREKAELSGVTVANGGIAGAIAAQQRGVAADQVARGCMAQKGYLLVPADQAEAKREELAAINAQKQQQEAAAAIATKRK